MLRRVYIIITNRSINNLTITVNDQPYNYGDTYEEGIVLNIRVTASGYSDFAKQVMVSSSNLVLNVELVPSGNFVDLTSAQDINGYKTFSGDKVFNNKWYNQGLRINKAFPSSDTELFKSSCGIYIDDIENNELGSYYFYHNRDAVSTEYLGNLMRVWNNEDSSYEIFGISKSKIDNVITYSASASSNIKSSITNWSFPSNSWIQLSLPDSSNYLTPSNNGFFFLRALTTGTQYILFSANHHEVSQESYYSGQVLRIFLPVSKNERIAIGYSTPKANATLYFLKAIGG